VRASQFETIRSEGGLLPVDLLQRVAGRDKDLGGLRGEDYGLPPNEPQCYCFGPAALRPGLFGLRVVADGRPLSEAQDARRSSHP
jgi:hypothetical protein